jgi:hypothetical protein
MSEDGGCFRQRQESFAAELVTVIKFGDRVTYQLHDFGDV